MEGKIFGKLDTGADVYEYTLKNDVAKVNIITYGGAVRTFEAFGVDIVGGYDKIEDYVCDDSHQGALIGRVANRIGGASFTMGGEEYKLPKNDGDNCLHGGDGFDRRIWQVEGYDGKSITLAYSSPDGEEGFPAELLVKVTYTLLGSALIIDYTATPFGKTPIALTNHSYFNLDGLGGTILEHTAEIYADRYTEVSDTLIPNGSRPDVRGTRFDFNTPHRIGERIGDDFIGYDHNFLLSPKAHKSFFGKSLGLAAKICGKRLKMCVYTDQPGIQFYIGNFLGGKPDFKGGIPRVLHGAFCLETQTEPDCISHGIGFYNAGEIYRHTTVYEIKEIN